MTAELPSDRSVKTGSQGSRRLNEHSPNLIGEPVKNLHARGPKACCLHTVEHGQQRHTEHPPAQPAAGIGKGRERVSLLAFPQEAFAGDEGFVVETEKSGLHAAVGFGEQKGNGYPGDLAVDQNFDVDLAVGAAP